MRTIDWTAALTLILLPTSSASAGQIIAANSGLVAPDHVLDFGANLYPNFTPITNQFPGFTFSHTAYFTTGTSNNLVGGFLTNDFSGGTNTLTVVFAAPITDLSFVYHQISTAAPSNFRVLLAGSLVDSFSNTSDQVQPNNYFGFTNLLFDELQLDFVSDFNIDTLAYNDGAGGGPVSYCPPPSGNSVSAGGAVLTSAGGYGTAAATFNLNDVPNQPGLLYAGPMQTSLAFGCGLRCVGGQTLRGSIVVPSGNQLLGTPFDMSPALAINIQYWYRDPANLPNCGDVFSLSNALQP